MRTEYTFNVNTAELVFSRRLMCNHVYTINYYDEMGIQNLTGIVVGEDDTAEREFFEHFGDDSSWPPGWWARMGSPQVTRARTWQEYFGVHCPNREPFCIPTKPRTAPPKSTLGFFTRESWRKENYS